MMRLHVSEEYLLPVSARGGGVWCDALPCSCESRDEVECFGMDASHERSEGSEKSHLYGFAGVWGKKATSGRCTKFHRAQPVHAEPLPAARAEARRAGALRKQCAGRLHAP